MSRAWWWLRGWLIERLAAGASVAVNLDYDGRLYMRGKWIGRNICLRGLPRDVKNGGSGGVVNVAAAAVGAGVDATH